MPKLTVVVSTPFPDDLLRRMQSVSADVTVRRARAEGEDYADADVVYCFTPPSEPAHLRNLKWVQLHLAGVNALYDHPIYASDIPLTTTSGVHAAAVAEYTLNVLLALAHRMPRVYDWQRQGTWPPDERRWDLFVPAEVRGTTLGILGYGSIGREVARLAKAFGMRVVVTKRDITQRADDGYYLPGTGDPDGTLPDAWVPMDRLAELLAPADYLVNALPMTPATAGLLDGDCLAAMKPSAYLINVGRGGTIDEAALAHALQERWIAGAALDVFTQEPLPDDSPFYQLDNVIVSAHVSGFIPSYDAKCTDLFCENLLRFLDGRPLLNLVDRSRGY